MANSITFDTYAYIKRLKEAGFTEQQAEAQSEALSKAFNEFQGEQLTELVTTGRLTNEIKTLEIHLTEKLAEHKTDILKWVVGLLFAQTGILIAAFFAVARMLSK
jgi:hypothetical protein